MKDKEQRRKEYIKELYQEKIIIDRKIKDLLKRSSEIETFLYWFADEDYMESLKEYEELKRRS